MNCREYKLIASEYIDRVLDEVRTANYEAHVTACADCNLHLDQIRSLSLGLKHSKRPQTPRELHSNVMSAVRRKTVERLPIADRLTDWLTKLNPHLVSYSAGVIASALLFTGTLAGFRPLPIIERRVPDVVSQTLDIIEVITGTDDEYHPYNGMELASPPELQPHSYELPRLSEHGAMASVTYLAFPKTGDESAAVLVEVESDGSARIVDVLSKPKDPYLIKELDWALKMKPFQPAKRSGSGQPIPTRIVLLNYKVDVTG